MVLKLLYMCLLSSKMMCGGVGDKIMRADESGQGFQDSATESNYRKCPETNCKGQAGKQELGGKKGMS